MGTYVQNWWNHALVREFALKNVDGAAGIRVCAITMMVAVVISYVFFIAFIRHEGKESFKLRNELELAHGIQQTLVRRSRCRQRGLKFMEYRSRRDAGFGGEDSGSGERFRKTDR